jgi:nitroreductase
MDVSEVIASRKTIRAFRADPIPLGTITDILIRAARAPSGGNLQPWRVYVLIGEARDELVRRVAEKRKETPMGEPPEYNIYPLQLTEPHRTRRFRVGEMMYTALGIPREDKMARLKFFAGNWEFFGAPAGFIFTMDRQMQPGQWADLGMFMQNIMLLARERGLHTCAQEAWAVWHGIIRGYLSIPENEMIFCGMAISVADETAPVFALETERAPLDEFVTVRQMP